MPNRVLANAGWTRSLDDVSWQQRRLFFKAWKVAKAMDHEISLNHRVTTNRSVRAIDVAFPKLKLGFEYDGFHWHDEKTDRKRDEELAEVG